MKRKIFVALLILLFLSNTTAFSASYIDKQIKASKKAQKFNSAQKHQATYDSNLVDVSKISSTIKDPKLITFEADKVKKVSDSLFQQKLKQDEIYYKKSVANNIISDKKYNTEYTKDFYSLYRVAERIIRSNKLDYINWRISLITDTKSFNASTTSGNLIYINSALYDSLYNNEDALAFVIGHELSHQILNHNKREQELYASTRNKFYNAAITSAAALSDLVVVNPPTSKYILKQVREMEYEADSLGMELAIRAGYDFNKAMDTLDFLENLSISKESAYDTHPPMIKRIENLKETKKYFLAQWVEEGKSNIYNSKPLICKISSDNRSIILTSQGANKNGHYKQETTEDLLKRIGYVEYKNGNMKNAIKYFSKWADMSNSYIPHLYLSYSYENLYKQTNKPKFLEKAQEEAKLANTITPNEKNVTQQIVDVSSL